MKVAEVSMDLVVKVNIAQRKVVVVAAAMEIMGVEVETEVVENEVEEGQMEAIHEVAEEYPLEKE